MFSRSAAFYDLIYQAAGKDYRAESLRLHELIQIHEIPDGSSLLDVGCGTGAHLVHLKDFYSVEGLDVDRGMLVQAKSKLPGIPIHEADMAQFSLGRSYDLVVSLFSSIGYAKTVARLNTTIARMADHAREGGLVIVEPWLGPEGYRAGVPHAVFVDQPELKIARFDVSQVKGSRSILNFQYLVASKEGVASFSERHELGLFTQAEYLVAIEAARLEPTYDPQGIDGRGLYLGVKSQQ